MTASTLALLLLDLVIISGLAWILGMLAKQLGQPAVIGEILGGILLGPTFFGGALTHTLFPVSVLPSLTMLANIGVTVFMFLVGMELNKGLLRGQRRIATNVALSAVVIPFLLGALLGLHLFADHQAGHRLAFVLFMGMAMSVTAFPVLARILTDRELLQTPIGGLALACASVDDVLAWSLLAVITALAGGSANPWQALFIVPFVAVLLLVVRPLLARLAGRADTVDWSKSPVIARLVGVGVCVAVTGGLYLSAMATEAVGLHLIFGAFLFGVVMPREEGVRLRERVVPRVRRLCAILLPVFFMAAGIKVDLSSVDGRAIGELGLILLVAIGGKGLGAFAGARLSRVPTRHSAVLAILMNTRGLTELIVLTVGLQLQLLDTQLYSLMVVMALVTTAMTGALLRFVYPPHRARGDMAPPTAVSGPDVTA